MLIKVFHKVKEYTKGNGIKVTVYKPDERFKLYITAIDINTGNIAKKQIVEYTKHENLVMYKVTIPKLNNHTIWVSEDHSLIVYDKQDKTLKKISPKQILEDSERYYLIRKTDNDNINNNKLIDDSQLVKHLVNQGCEFYNCKHDVIIEYDPNVTVGYDLGVEDYYTFSDDKGIFVQDTFAVFVPFTKEGIQDSLKLLNPYHPANPRRLKYEFNKDYKYALCLIWSDPIKPDYADKYWWWKSDTIKFIGKTYPTTKGRKTVFEKLPEEVHDKIDIDWFLTKQKPENVASYLLERGVDVNIVKEWLYQLQLLANEVMSQLNIDLDIQDMMLSEKLKPLVEKLDENAPLDEIQKQLDIINDKLKELIRKETDELLIMNECGVAKFGQLSQLLAVKGLILSPQGEVVLIKSNFSEGLKPTEYFEAGHGARMGIVSRAQKTAISGYLQRQIVYATAPVELDEYLDDCGTGKGLDMYITEDLAKRLINRNVIINGKTIKITPDNYKDIVNKRVVIRSPIYCISKKVCKTCYGDDYKLLDTTKIGFVAAEAIGERLSQEMMKAFHTGGVVKFTLPNPIEEAVNSIGIDRKKLEEFVTYNEKDKQLIANQNLTIALDKDYYNLNAFLRDSSIVNFELEALVCDIVTDKESIPYAFDSVLSLHRPSEYKIEKDRYVLSYNKDDVIFTVLPATSSVEIKTKRILTILQGKGKFVDISHLITKIYNEMKDFGDIILVHIEVLLSQLLRCPDDLSKPFRLCKNQDKQPVLVGLKKVPYLESWKRGLEFERVGDAIDNALVNPELEENTSLLEKLL